MGFLSGLGDAFSKAITEQILPGDNTTRSLDLNGVPYGALGNFASRLDQSATRTYIEDGFIRNVQPRQLEILMQEPDVTVLIKKRMFSSLAQNYRFDLMDDEEKLFVKASKKLFENKCNVIAAYEKLSKIEKIILNTGILNSYMLPQIFSGLQALDAAGLSIIDGKTRAVFETIRKLNAFSETNNTTTWLNDKDTTFVSASGNGTGVIELTMATSISTVCSTAFGSGGGTLQVADPYKLMIITREDIDKAIIDASNKFNNNNFFTFADKKLSDLVDQDKIDLNQQRAQRNASPIRFLLNPNTVISKKLKAIIDGEGREINFNFSSGDFGFSSNVELDPAATTGKNGLSDEDVSLFSRIVKNTFQLLALRDQTQSNVRQFNQQTNLVRKKMRLHFANKPIIQPLDVVNIFATSKSKIDTKASVNLQPNFTAPNIVKELNNTVRNIGENLADLKGFFSGNGNSAIEVEKNAIVGVDFPTWLWRLLRNDFTRQAAGVSIFVGLVKEAKHTYDSGAYNLSVELEDNAGYFNKSKVNFNPSIDVYNSALYDPLTPFKLTFDDATGVQAGKIPPLLDENIRLLNSGILKFTSGRFRGATANEIGYSNVDYEKSNNTFRRVLNDPNGFVYRWKEGIGSLTQFSEPHPTDILSRERSPKITSKAFAGQDVMNVLSLLISGTPYNFNTFMKAAVQSSSLSNDDFTNEHGSRSFFRGLIDDLSKNNQVWGNFVPFKKLIVSDVAYNFLASGQASAIAQNAELNDLLKQRAELFDKLTQLNSKDFSNGPQIPSTTDLIKDPLIADLVVQINLLDTQITQAQRNFSENIDKVNIGTAGQIKIFGDDISFDDTTIINNNAQTDDQRKADREELRKRINYLSLRRLWKVKANEDQNLFIVDDAYDKDYDILAFEKSLSNKLELFNSDYQDVKGQISTVMELLGLEVFADSQGHIRARAPQYNRVPSSVFFQMFRDKFKTGIQVFPQFLERLFANQIQNFSEQLEIIEDQIRLRAAVLGNFTDADANRLINGFSGGSNSSFQFATEEETGRFGSKDLRVMLQQKDPDTNEQLNTKSLDELSNSVSGALKTFRNFDIARRVQVVNHDNFVTNFDDVGVDRIFKIRERLKMKLGKPAPTIKELLSNDRLETNIRSQTDILKITNEIAQFISERHKTLLTLSNAIKNLDQGAKLNNTNEGASAALYPFLSGNKNQIPDILEHMVEDEDYDDLGPGSGSRYLIKEHQIISLSITETPPEYTVAEVNGLFAEGFTPPPNEFAATGVGTGGNLIASAWAVDYDMWKQYGFRSTHTWHTPYFSDPINQCAPFAVYLLNRARRNILKGDLTIVGNEYIQAGEVIYIEDRDLLFYVEKVQHRVDIGSRFTTNLSLTYGHNPGEYIPTMLDIVGKSLYANKNLSSDYRSVRYDDDSNGDVSINAIAFDNRATLKGDISDLTTGSFGDTNRKNLANILLSITGVFSPEHLSQIPLIDIRIYSNSDLGIAPNENLKSLANEIAIWLKNPTANNLLGNDLLPEVDMNGIHIKNDQVKINEIDLASDTTHSPSKAAISLARIIGDSASVQASLPNDVNNLLASGQDLSSITSLYSSVLDVWLTFTDPVTTISTSKSQVEPASELELQQFQQLDTEFR